MYGINVLNVLEFLNFSEFTELAPSEYHFNTHVAVAPQNNN